MQRVTEGGRSNALVSRTSTSEQLLCSVRKAKSFCLRRASERSSAKLGWRAGEIRSDAYSLVIRCRQHGIAGLRGKKASTVLALPQAMAVVAMQLQSVGPRPDEQDKALADDGFPAFIRGIAARVIQHHWRKHMQQLPSCREVQSRASHVCFLLRCWQQPSAANMYFCTRVLQDRTMTAKSQSWKKWHPNTSPVVDAVVHEVRAGSTAVPGPRRGNQVHVPRTDQGSAVPSRGGDKPQSS